MEVRPLIAHKVRPLKHIKVYYQSSLVKSGLSLSDGKEVHGGKRTFTSLNKRKEKSWEGLSVNQHVGTYPCGNRRWLSSICPLCIELIHVGKYLSMDKPMLLSIPRRMVVGHKTSISDDPRALTL